MNAKDILGELIRGGSGGVIKDIFGRRSGDGAPSTPGQAPPSSARVPESSGSLEQQIRDLEASLGVGGESSGSTSRPASVEREAPSPRMGNRQGSLPTDWNAVPQKRSRRIPEPVPPRPPEDEPTPEEEDGEAIVLLRAMIHAAKADGRLSQEEQQAILQRVDSRSSDAMRFLKNEFNEESDVREFAWSVPMGLEYKVYAISLSAIDLDTKAESDYLKELAHGLRLPLEVRQHIHQRYGVPLP